MKKMVFFMMVSCVCVAESISYKGMGNEKKYVIDTTDEMRDLQIQSQNYGMMFDAMSNLTSGQTFIENMEDEKGKISIGNSTYFLGNKDKYNIVTSIKMDKIMNYEDMQFLVGGDISYVNGKIKNDKMNGMNLGVNAKIYVPEYKFKLKMEQKLNYTNIKYKENFVQNYLGLVGGIDLKTTIGKNFFIEPIIRANYTYSFKVSVKDQNNDEIKILPNINFSVGGGARIGYNFNDKIRVSVGYIADKRLNNENKYKIYDKEIINKEANNYLFHDADLQIEMNLKEKHKFLCSIGKISKGFKGGMSYKYEW